MHGLRLGRQHGVPRRTSADRHTLPRLLSEPFRPPACHLRLLFPPHTASHLRHSLTMQGADCTGGLINKGMPSNQVSVTTMTRARKRRGRTLWTALSKLLATAPAHPRRRLKEQPRGERGTTRAVRYRWGQMWRASRRGGEGPGLNEAAPAGTRRPNLQFAGHTIVPQPCLSGGSSWLLQRMAAPHTLPAPIPHHTCAAAR